MKVENISARLYVLSDGTKLVPGAPAVEVDDSHSVSLKGITELRITHAEKSHVAEKITEVVEFKPVPATKAELVAALTEKGIKFDQSQSKADLQALYDSAD